ncbi:hypothetical protein GMB86_11055 [Terrilactibacillus sp. BCM23-1]|uniref:Uncharacterized protein n=1 Tax=Terrilactibacillus tamarindi TaxID=2599694 RepID=A0A6N8CU46_9BACI|nr:hypothetical protein [Terrilactibacillus tamarindi]MTT32545.1 hypothetical protein [Terrilactibacillus tamarindi]
MVYRNQHQQQPQWPSPSNTFNGYGNMTEGPNRPTEYDPTTIGTSYYSLPFQPATNHQPMSSPTSIPYSMLPGTETNSFPYQPTYNSNGHPSESYYQQTSMLDDTLTKRIEDIDNNYKQLAESISSLHARLRVIEQRLGIPVPPQAYPS